ncbi:MAG: S41 family peptidase [Chloroflexota bacterium]
MNRRPQPHSLPAARPRRALSALLLLLALLSFGCRAAERLAGRAPAGPSWLQTPTAAGPHDGPPTSAIPAAGQSAAPTAVPPTTAPPTPALPAASVTLPPTPATVAPEFTLQPTDPPGDPQANQRPPTLTPAPITPVAPDPQRSARQMQVFDALWDFINDHYLYRDFNGLDWDAVRSEYTALIDAGINDADFYLAMLRMVRNLGDQHSAFMDPEAAAAQDAQFSGAYRYVGIGVMTAVVPDEQRLAVLVVFPNSPAEQAGIRMRDSLISADGQPLVDERGARISLLRGEAGTSVTLQVQTPGEAPRTLTVTRRQVTEHMPVPYQTFQSPGGRRIGYIFIPTFNDDQIDEGVAAALEAMTAGAPLDGLVIDNRHNGGGISTVLNNTLAYFTDGLVGYFVEGRQEMPVEVEGVDLNGSQQVPLVVLVGEGSASFGEIFSGLLHDLGRAYLIGTTTDGNVEILSIVNLPDGSRAWIAASTFRPVNQPDANWETTGIVPDLQAPADWTSVTLEDDPAILAALAYFDQR